VISACSASLSSVAAAGSFDAHSFRLPDFVFFSFFSLEHCASIQLCRSDLFLCVAVLRFVLRPSQLFLLLFTRGSSIPTGEFSFLLSNPATWSCSSSSPTCGVLWPQQPPIVFGFFSAPSSLLVLCLVLAASPLN
jgi:hypothetical protein